MICFRTSVEANGSRVSRALTYMGRMHTYLKAVARACKQVEENMVCLYLGFMATAALVAQFGKLRFRINLPKVDIPKNYQKSR